MQIPWAPRKTSGSNLLGGFLGSEFDISLSEMYVHQSVGTSAYNPVPPYKGPAGAGAGAGMVGQAVAQASA